MPELGVSNLSGIQTKELLMYSYLGLSAGDLMSGLLSQLFQSRKKVIYLYLASISVCMLIFLFNHQVSINYFRFMSFILGAATGYWALFVTNASEQFGTNIRSTVTATVPNFVRFGVVPLTLGFEFFSKSGWFSQSPNIMSALIVGVISLLLAWWGTSIVKESFHKDLNYYES
jgi:hypothetical protein